MLSTLNQTSASESKTPPIPPETQRICIDLPGEDFKCYVHKPKVQVMLRKHRDVIFDIQLFKGMSYTVHTEKGDFYNVRDKKLVEAKRKQNVTFKDGEKLHLWVSRKFEGALILKAASGATLGRYEPNSLDPVKYGEEPGEKPAPLMVVLKNTPEQQPKTIPLATARSQAQSYQCKLGAPFECGLWNLSPTARLFGVDAIAPYDRNKPVSTSVEEHPVVAVVDGEADDMPQKIKDYFRSGGGKSGLADIDTNEVATRNWLLGQLAGTAAYVGDNWNWLRHSINRQADGAFKLVSAKVAYVRGKVRIYFSGYAKSNPAFGQGGHGPSNAKILQVYAGVGQAGAAFKATTKAIAGTFRANAAISFIFGVGTSYAEWKADAQKDGYDFTAAFLTSVVKAIVAAALTVMFVAAILFVLMVFLEMAVGAIVVGGITVLAGLGINYLVEATDKALGKEIKGKENTDGLAGVAAPWLRDMGDHLGKLWDGLKAKMPTDYEFMAAP